MIKEWAKIPDIGVLNTDFSNKRPREYPEAVACDEVNGLVKSSGKNTLLYYGAGARNVAHGILLLHYMRIEGSLQAPLTAQATTFFLVMQ